MLVMWQVLNSRIYSRILDTSHCEVLQEIVSASITFISRANNLNFRVIS